MDFDVTGADCPKGDSAAGMGLRIFSITNGCCLERLDRITEKCAPLFAQRKLTSLSSISSG
jgi:hypothetical protein